MQLVNDFTVPRPIDQAWEVLTDVERIAPCMPGAQLTEVEGDVYLGLVKVKVGPVVAQFTGQAHFRERDDARHRAVLEARGKESSGRGLASAVVTAELAETGGETQVHVMTDLTITGRLAQFGRGAMADISSRMLGQFLDCLERTVLAQESAQVQETAEPPAATGPERVEPERVEPGRVEPGRVEPGRVEEGPADASAPAAARIPEQLTEPPAMPDVVVPAAPGARRSVDGTDAVPVDLLRTAGVPVLKRVVPLVLLVAVVIVLVVLLVR